MTLNVGQQYNDVRWQLTGDDFVSLCAALGCEHSNMVIDWEWNYRAGHNDVKMSTSGYVIPQDFGDPLPSRYGGPVGIFTAFPKSGNGIPATVGTVTILADILDDYAGAALPVMGSFGGEIIPLAMSPFTVVPEPSAALSLDLGGLVLAGLVRQRE